MDNFQRLSQKPILVLPLLKCAALLIFGLVIRRNEMHLNWMLLGENINTTVQTWKYKTLNGRFAGHLF